MLVWNDVKSFSRHLVNMRAFRLSHGPTPKSNYSFIKDIPVLQETRLHFGNGGAFRPSSSLCAVIAIPLWKITLPENIRN